jgi:hypothetical protein
MRTRALALALATLCFVAVGSRPSVGFADPPTDQDKARALFKDGRALASEGKYGDACPKFEQSLKLDVGIGTKYNLADCFEHVSRPLAAQTLFLEVADLAHASGQREREDAARARASALDSAIPRLVIDVKVGSPKLEIRRDGAVVEPKTWGAPLPVDPGPHEVEATAPGRKPWSSKVDVRLAGSPVTVAVPELEDTNAKPALVCAPPPRHETEPTPARPPQKKTKAEPPPRTKDNTIPIILYSGVGAGALLTGVSLVLYKVSNDQAQRVCPKSVGCTADEIRHHESLVRDAQATRNLSYLGLGVVGASLITAGVLSLTSGTGKEGSRQGVVAGPVVGRDEVGAEVMGRF